MSETLKSQFYEACPFWWWPVLWWQLALMEDYLAHIKANIGVEDMTYGLALGPYGSVHLIYLSDAARHFALTGQRHIKPYQPANALVLESPLPVYLGFNALARLSARQLATACTGIAPAPLYHDPG